jgi:hypothetical protein
MGLSIIQLIMAEGIVKGGDSSRALTRGGEYSSNDDPYIDFAGRVIDDAGFRLRLSQVLADFDISKFTIDHLGYETGPFAKVAELVKDLGLEELTDEGKKAAANAVLGASVEVRDALNLILNRNGGHPGFAPSESYIAKLPYPLQVVVLAKACAGSGGSPLYPYELAANSEERQKVCDYLQARLLYSMDKANVTLDVVSVIHGTAILANHFERGLRSVEHHDLGGYPSAILGEPTPHMGHYLPNSVEEALRALYDGNLWRLSYVGQNKEDQAAREEDENFINGLSWLAGEVAKLSGMPPDESPMWRAYTITAIYANNAFKGDRVQGFSSVIDRLCSWDEPKPDAAYWGSYLRLCENLSKCSEVFSEFAEEGVLLALKGFAIRIAHGVEQEIVYGKDTARTERIKVVAAIYRMLVNYNQQQADELLATTPLLSSHIKELADPSGYRFSYVTSMLLKA